MRLLRALPLFLLLAVFAWASPATAGGCRGSHGVAACGSPGPTLTLNFLSGTIDPRVSFSRPSGATSALYTDAAGASFTTYTSNQPRLSSNGLLIEEQRTNYLLNSNAPATQTTASLPTGTYVLFGNGTGSLTSAAGTAVGSGFGALSTLSGNFQAITITTAGTVTITVSGTVDWFDLQAGAFPTSHIVTTSSTVTRSADVATVATSAFGFNPNAGTLIFVGIVENNTGSNGFLQVDDGENNNRLQMSSNPGAYAVVGGSITQNLGGGSWSANVLHKMGFAFQANSSAAAIDGAITATASSGAIPTGLTTLHIGPSVSGGTALDGWVQRVIYYPRRKASSQLQSLTQ